MQHSLDLFNSTNNNKEIISDAPLMKNLNLKVALKNKIESTNDIFKYIKTKVENIGGVQFQNVDLNLACTVLGVKQDSSWEAIEIARTKTANLSLPAIFFHINEAEKRQVIQMAHISIASVRTISKARVLTL